jgi:AraC-like DNA-binding protein
MVFFAETTPVCWTVHAPPAWKVLLPVGDTKLAVQWGDDRFVVQRRGLLVPPKHRHSAESDGPRVSLFVDVWMAPRSTLARPQLIDELTTRGLLDALDIRDAVIDVHAAARRLAPLLGPVGQCPAALGKAVDRLDEVDLLSELAAEVGMSGPRLRAMVQSEIGVPLVQLRTWSRLTRAIAWLPYASSASAAALAGFADQPHLTRVARRFLGRTPGEIDVQVQARPAATSTGRWYAQATEVEATNHPGVATT